MSNIYSLIAELEAFLQKVVDLEQNIREIVTHKLGSEGNSIVKSNEVAKNNLGTLINYQNKEISLNLQVIFLECLNFKNNLYNSEEFWQSANEKNQNKIKLIQGREASNERNEMNRTEMNENEGSRNEGNVNQNKENNKMETEMN